MHKTHRLALFSHYSTGQLPAYVQVYLKELRLHVDRLILIHNDGAPYGLAEDCWCEDMDIIRWPVPNAGFDFGMWSRFTDLLTPLPAELVLANDSCVPVRSLSSLFSAARDCRSAAFGVTDSRESNVHHLQSYFLVLKPAAAAIMAERLRMRGVVDGGVSQVIAHHELGFSAALADAGLSIASAFRVRQDYLYNPSIFDAPTLLDSGVPLLKRRLLQKRIDRGSYKRYLRTWGQHPGAELLDRVPRSELMRLDWLGHTPESVIAKVCDGGLTPPSLNKRRTLEVPIRRALRSILGAPHNLTGGLSSDA